MAVGEESIGFGGTLEINDGAGDTFVAVDMIVTLGIPNYTVGTVESKRLDLPGGVIKKLATLKNGGSLTVKQQFTNAGYARMNALRDAKAEKQFRFTIPDDDGDTQVTVPGLVTANKVSDLDAEKITEFDTTIEVSGAEV